MAMHTIHLIPGMLIVDVNRDNPDRGFWGTFLGWNRRGLLTVRCAGFLEHGALHRWREGGPHTYFAQPFDVRTLTEEERTQVTERLAYNDTYPQNLVALFRARGPRAQDRRNPSRSGSHLRGRRPTGAGRVGSPDTATHGADCIVVVRDVLRDKRGDPTATRP